MDKKTIAQIMDWLGSNWGWAIAILCTFFEIAPIKIHPITAILGWLGKKLTGSIKKDIDDLKKDTDKNYNKLQARMDETEKAVDMQRIEDIRSSVLDFANSCLNHRKHTKEEFDHILQKNVTYEKLVEKYGIDNEVYTESYNYIKRIYRKLLDSKTFLTVPVDDET